MKDKSCVVVLVGLETAGTTYYYRVAAINSVGRGPFTPSVSATISNKWAKYEIETAWNAKKGVVGIRIHGLKDQDGKTSKEGKNPFDGVKVNIDGKDKKLSDIVKCYNPAGDTSTEKYDWIKENLSDKVEEAIKIRKDPC